MTSATVEGVIAISASFTAEPIKDSLDYWLHRLQIPLAVKHASFNQIFQTLLDPGSLFRARDPGVNVVLLRWQDLGQNSSQIEQNGHSLIETLARVATEIDKPFVVASCPPSGAFHDREGAPSLIVQLDDRLSESIASLNNVYSLPVSKLKSLYSIAEIHDPLGEHLGEIPYTREYFVALGTALARHVASLRRTPFKVIALDLDNTLWAGVVGEDGPQGIQITEAHRRFQEFLLHQRSEGMLLTLCSKNNENDAWEVFESRPEMLLKKEHFAAWRVDWQPKFANLGSMAKELSLGADSFIFLDDNAKECGEMRANCPECLTLQVPENSRDLPRFLDHLWAFDRARVTEADRKRNESYEAERARASAVKTATSLEDFVKALDLSVSIEPMAPELLPRVAQLTQRTNQFNTTTIRRTETEIRNLLASGDFECITFSVKDRFGDYGNVGAILYQVNGATLTVDSFLLSCRALGRGVEHEIVRYLGREAQQRGCSEVVIRFIASPKNTPAFTFLDSLPAEWKSGGSFARALHMSADAAANVLYKPVAYGDEIVATESERKSTTGAVSSIDYLDIAQHLNTAAAIQEAINAGRRELFTPVGEETATAPRNQTESELAAIWADVLGRPQVSIHDDFFELGGDSLKAVELLIRINETFDVPDITLSAVLDAPTVAKFAPLLGERKSVRCLVALRESGTRPPVFFVPGAGGNVLSFRDLAMSLPDDQPFFALQAPGLDGSEVLDDAKAIAALYINEIRTVQARGPYFLGGSSYGGVIAFEMAQQLTAQGEEVAILALLDTYNLAYGKMIPRTKAIFCHVRFFGQRTAAYIARLAKTPVSGWPQHLTGARRNSMKIVRKTLRMFVAAPANQSQPRPAGPRTGPGSQPNQVVGVIERVLEANMRAVERYVPTPYPGTVTLFRANVPMVEPYQDKYLGWGPVAKGGVEIEMIPGRHSEFEIAILGDRLNQRLLQAQHRSGAVGEEDQLVPASSNSIN